MGQGQAGRGEPCEGGVWLGKEGNGLTCQVGGLIHALGACAKVRYTGRGKHAGEQRGPRTCVWAEGMGERRTKVTT